MATYPSKAATIFKNLKKNISASPKTVGLRSGSKASVAQRTPTTKRPAGDLNMRARQEEARTRARAAGSRTGVGYGRTASGLRSGSTLPAPKATPKPTRTSTVSRKTRTKAKASKPKTTAAAPKRTSQPLYHPPGSY